MEFFWYKSSFLSELRESNLSVQKDMVTKELHKGLETFNWKPRPYQSLKMQLFSMSPVNYKGSKSKPGQKRPERFFLVTILMKEIFSTNIFKELESKAASESSVVFLHFQMILCIMMCHRVVSITLQYYVT